MSSKSNYLVSFKEFDAIESYFQCVTACSLSEEGVECLTQCVVTHIREELEQ